MINDLKASGEWRTQLSTAINFVFHEETSEIRVIHSKNDNKETVIGNEIDEIIQELFYCLLQKYKKGLEKLMKGSKFVFGRLDVLHYKCHKISINRGESCIDSRK